MGWRYKGESLKINVFRNATFQYNNIKNGPIS